MSASSMLVGGVGSGRASTPMDLGVQASPTGRGWLGTRHLSGVGDLQAPPPQRSGGCPERGPNELGQSPGQIDDAGLVVDRDQGYTLTCRLLLG